MTPDQTVLLVEDDEAILAMLIDLLQSEGYRVCVAGDGRAALECVEKETPDVVVSDVVIPHVNGVDLAKRLREQQIPVIPTSASRLDMTVPGVDFVAKPFDLDEMLSAITGVLKQNGLAAGDEF